MEPPDPGEQALQKLLSGDTPQDKLVSSIEAVFSSRKAIATAGHLRRSDAQPFIDAVDEVGCHPPVPAKL